MARRLIGLDIGTNAVTVAEVRAGNPPRLEMFGQVALGRETMREGEVADDAAVTEAVGRLRAEVGLKKVSVRLGLASPRVVVRQIEMPLMSREELGSALQFQAAELIPIPLDDAVLDFAILGPASPGDGGEPRMHVLLAAVQEATVARLVAAVEAGGLQVAAVDLVPLALIRPLARAVPDLALVGAGAAGDPGVALPEGHVGAEGIVSFGGGVTAIAVHEGGVPRFVRVLGTGGRELTDAIASELDLPPETAEALKRQLGGEGHDELVTRARASIERPLSVLLDEVRSSIDYYRNQSGSSPLLRIVVTGGGAQLPGLSERLSALVGVPVEQSREHLGVTAALVVSVRNDHHTFAVQRCQVEVLDARGARCAAGHCSECLGGVNVLLAFAEIDRVRVGESVCTVEAAALGVSRLSKLLLGATAMLDSAVRIAVVDLVGVEQIPVDQAY